jgi:hypothetical protein
MNPNTKRFESLSEAASTAARINANLRRRRSDRFAEIGFDGLDYTVDFVCRLDGSYLGSLEVGKEQEG